MYIAEYQGINSFLVGSSKILIEHGVTRRTRGYDCVELPEPFMFKLSNPTSRIVSIRNRHWNPILPYAESLWLASGCNDLNLVSHYLKKMSEFSDDGCYLRGGYGPRLRGFSGIADDYKVGLSEKNQRKTVIDVDQFKYIYLSFQRDINTRQAVINIVDPPKDYFDIDGNLKFTKDFPCTQILQLQKQPQSNKLNLTVYMRSNDFLWGASAVNIFNYTFHQEYFSQILGLEVGDYFHVANNFHYYKNFEEKVYELANLSTKDYIDDDYKYNKSFNSFEAFEQMLQTLKSKEMDFRMKSNKDLIDFKDDFFNDWQRVFHIYNFREELEFTNPLLNKILKKYII